MKNRHMIIRLAIAVIWAVAAVIGFIKGNTALAVLALCMCAAFGYSAFTMKNKD